MEIEIISKAIIKPSSPQILHKKPFKLSLFDQLTPATYSPIICFYPIPFNNNDSHHSTQILIDKLKNSLSETLNLYYPYSGRTNDNLYIQNFDEGVPFLEAKVNMPISKFLKHQEIELLNNLLPCQPFAKPSDICTPLLAGQVNIFTCGSIALGLCFSHKFTDGLTGRAFLNTWASISNGNNANIIHPNLDQPSLFFPPRPSLPQNHLSLMETLWFSKDNYQTRRFVFSSNAIASLRAKGGEKLEKKPSRIETLSCFIWRICMKASKSLFPSRKLSVFVEAVNLRTRTNPPMSDASIGNLFWLAQAGADPSKDTEIELPELVKMINEAIGLYSSDYTESLQGKDGFEVMSEYCNQLEDLFSAEKPDIFVFSSWCYLGFTKLDFGWGEPFWIGMLGKVGSAFRNLTVFIEAKDGKGIEAWVTLDKKRMDIVEKDPELLAFASLNPKISSL